MNYIGVNFKRYNGSACTVSLLIFTSASILVQLELCCWPLSAAQKAFATIIVVLKCQLPTLLEKRKKKNRQNDVFQRYSMTCVLMHLCVLCVCCIWNSQMTKQIIPHLFIIGIYPQTCCFSQQGVTATLEITITKQIKMDLNINTWFYIQLKNGLEFYIWIH